MVSNFNAVFNVQDMDLNTSLSSIDRDYYTEGSWENGIRIMEEKDSLGREEE